MQQANQPQCVEPTAPDSIPEDFTQFRVVDLRKMVQKALMQDGNEMHLNKNTKLFSLAIFTFFPLITFLF